MKLGQLVPVTQSLPLIRALWPSRAFIPPMISLQQLLLPLPFQSSVHTVQVAAYCSIGPINFTQPDDTTTFEIVQLTVMFLTTSKQYYWLCLEDTATDTTRNDKLSTVFPCFVAKLTLAEENE